MKKTSGTSCDKNILRAREKEKDNYGDVKSTLLAWCGEWFRLNFLNDRLVTYTYISLCSVRLIPLASQYLLLVLYNEQA